MAGITQKTALVTGASAGIGAAFARALAREGFDLVVTARRAERLQALAGELKTRHRTKTHIFVGDLSKSDTPLELFRKLSEDGISIDLLVNNAGYGMAGTFNQPSWQQHEDFIQVMVTAPTRLSYLVLPGMVERGYGRIINVASLAGLIPGSPRFTLYGAAKAFMIKVTESLSSELAGTGVHVLAVCPGYTYTEFHDVLGNRDEVSQYPSLMWQAAEEVVALSLVAVERDEVLLVPGRVNRAIASAAKLLPDAFARHIIRRDNPLVRKN